MLMFGWNQVDGTAFKVHVSGLFILHFSFIPLHIPLSFLPSYLPFLLLSSLPPSSACSVLRSQFLLGHLLSDTANRLHIPRVGKVPG